MDKKLRSHAQCIIESAIAAVLPDEAVRRALKTAHLGSNVILVAAGKAAWQMAKTARECLGSAITKGIVITKYDHVKAPIEGIECYEAGHPVPDENSFAATEKALAAVQDLTEKDTVLFLLSGGGSALFEKPLISGTELQSITQQLLASGADITKINTIRKRLSAVKGGKFALSCTPAKVFSIVLSDIIGDPLDMIASGPAYPDSSTCAEAMAIAKLYDLKISDQAWELLNIETPKALDNVVSVVTGSVSELAAAAAAQCKALGYETEILTDRLDCLAKDAGIMLAKKIRSCAGQGKKRTFIAGGETVVQITGTGLGGRNQELALSAAEGIDGIAGAAIFSVGSDGTDGPTDAAGGYVDYESAAQLADKNISINAVLQDNDSYHALKAIDALIFTGPTGTNVNDVAVALYDPPC